MVFYFYFFFFCECVDLIAVLPVLRGGIAQCVNRGLVTHCGVQMCSLLAVEARLATGDGVRGADVRLPLPRAPEPTSIGYLGMRDWLLPGRYFVDGHAHCVQFACTTLPTECCQ